MADSGTITITGLEDFEKRIKQIETTNPGFEKRLRGAIKKVLGEVRSNMQKSAKDDLQMQSDPRKAYKAVRYAVYKRIFGGQVNILDGRKVTKGNYEPPKKGLPRRGGNRRVRSDRTQDLISYEGASRAFVLRFLNAGTKARYSGYGRNGRNENEFNKFVLNHNGRGFRGSIAARNWFGQRSHRELENAAANIQIIIDRVIKEEFV